MTGGVGVACRLELTCCPWELEYVDSGFRRNDGRGEGCRPYSVSPAKAGVPYTEGTPYSLALRLLAGIPTSPQWLTVVWSRSAVPGGWGVAWFPAFAGMTEGMPE